MYPGRLHPDSEKKNTHHAEMAELLIGRNLDWVEDGGIFREAAATANTKDKKR